VPIQFLLVLVVMANALSVLGVLVLFWRRGALGARPALTALAGAAFLYAFGYGLELAGTALDWKRASLVVQYLGIVAIAPLLLTVVADYAGARWLDRGWIRAAAWAFAAGAYAAVVTSTRNELFYLDLQLVQAGPLVMLDVRPGPVYYALQAFIGGAILVANVVLVRAWRRSSARDRGPMFTLMLASLVPWAANLAYLLGLVPWRLDGPPFLLLPIAVLFAWSVRNQALVELRPIARDQVVERLRDPVVVLDADDRIVDVNAAGQRFLRRLEVDPDRPTDDARRYRALTPWLGTRTAPVGPHDTDDAPAPAELFVDGRTLRVAPVDLYERGGRSSGRVLVFHDVSTYERMHRKLERLATTDVLTGLPNRRRFFDVARAWIASEEVAQRPSAWLILDIDEFKAVNDRYGHDAGDRVLRTVGASLLQHLRPDDLVARMGGEEFAVFLPDTGVEDAVSVAERLRAAIADLRTATNDGGIRVTTSIGACTVAGGDVDIDAVLAAADDALYRAKRAGRDRVVVGRLGVPRHGSGDGSGG
jgi:diguanylate cyclase (GGDEF)-like protein